MTWFLLVFAIGMILGAMVLPGWVNKGRKKGEEWLVDPSWLSAVVSLAALLPFALAGFVWNCTSACAVGQIVGTFLIIAAAAFFAGFLVGLLFGIPMRSSGPAFDGLLGPNANAERGEPVGESPDQAAGKSGERGSVTQQAAARERRLAIAYRPNTNLEQISDWLTKLLVGAGLVQLGAIKTGLVDFQLSIERAFATDRAPAAVGAFAVGVLLFYLITGFIFGYVWARTVLPLAFTKADEAAFRVIGSMPAPADNSLTTT